MKQFLSLFDNGREVVRRVPLTTPVTLDSLSASSQIAGFLRGLVDSGDLKGSVHTAAQELLAKYDATKGYADA